MWTKKRIINELKRLQEYYGLTGSLQHVVDYVMLHPKIVNRTLFKALSTQDFPEFRREL